MVHYVLLATEIKIIHNWATVMDYERHLFKNSTFIMNATTIEWEKRSEMKCSSLNVTNEGGRQWWFSQKVYRRQSFVYALVYGPSPLFLLRKYSVLDRFSAFLEGPEWLVTEQDCLITRFFFSFVLVILT